MSRKVDGCSVPTDAHLVTSGHSDSVRRRWVEAMQLHRLTDICVLSEIWYNQSTIIDPLLGTGLVSELQF